MGGDLAPPNPMPPTFTVLAEKDPLGADLDRIQIIKGSVEVYPRRISDEKIIDVVWSGERQQPPPARSALSATWSTSKTAKFTDAISVTEESYGSSTP